jgi:mono/diheme cytochrome c family protein
MPEVPCELQGWKMRGKLKGSDGGSGFSEQGTLVVQGLPLSADEEGAVSRMRRAVPWLAGVLVALIAGSALPQGNIDAGKTPAQMFADTCSNCHRRPQELRRASASFLRQHYTPGSQEAAAMANYLAGIPADARKERPKAQENKAQEKEREKAKPQQQAQDRGQPQERPRAQPVAKGKRPEVAKSAPVDPVAEAPEEARAESPVILPKLEPFEE